MNKKKTIALMVGGAALIVLIAAISISYFANGYTKYVSAYKKLFKSGSIECNFDAVMNIDNQDFKSTGNMKIKQNDKGQMMFMLTMTSGDTKLAEFTDGQYIYNDVNGVKTRFKIGDKSTNLEGQPSQKFDINQYEQKLASFLEAGRIKDLKLLDLVDNKYIKKIESKNTSSGKQYTLTFADELKSGIVKVFEGGQVNGNNDSKITMKSKDLICTFNENSSDILSGANYIMSFDITLPAKLTGESQDMTLPVTVDIKMIFVNPGSTVDFTFPSTDGYK